MFAEYGLDLWYDLGTRRLSWRRLGVLIRQLPPGSALHRAMYPDLAGWRTTDWLLADIIDLLQAANWQRANAGVKKGAQSPWPRPYTRPSADAGRRRTLADRVLDWKKRHIDEVTDGG